MQSFIVNRNVQANGDYEVHNDDWLQFHAAAGESGITRKSPNLHRRC